MILTVKKFIVILMLMPITAWACSGWVIGFRGLNEVFDHRAFADYAEMQGRCFRSFGWQQMAQAETVMLTMTQPYELYGFSAGAQTVAELLRRGRVRPDSVITVGAYRTVDVNFDRYGVPYRNYFDRSGRGQQSPGVYLDVSHDRVQAVVTRLLQSKITVQVNAVSK